MDKRMIAAVLGICALAAVMVPVTAEDAQGPAAVQTTANDRVYCVASVSKVYVTAAVMQLAEQGKVDLDAPVTEYVPNFRLDDERYKDITVRMLMDHTSGMEGSHERDWMLYADVTEPDYDEWLDELSHRRLKADPGAFAAYCNDGFTLLNIIVSNVSGMSYTDYLKENISDKIGAEHTGTFVDMYDDKDLVGVYKLGNAPHEFLYCLSPGSGGVCATAEDTAEFGSTFFKGDNRLLSEEVKDEMATRWDRGENEYTDGNGLGWDYVESLYYERSGIKVMGKGGDIASTHAHLMVAPDEEVSVAVLTSGGSSTYDRMMCEALLDVVLEERGKTVDKTAPEITIADSLPEGIESYAGVYSNFSQLSGIGTIKLYFDDRHLYTSVLGTGNSTPIIYSPTSDGGFVRVDENGNITASQEVMYFEERDGKVYIKGDSISAAPGLGEEVIKMYAAERIEENIISDAERSAWEEMAGRTIIAYDEKWSSQEYDDPFMMFTLSDELPGYLVGTRSSSQFGIVGRAFKIVSDTRAEYFQTVPSSADRDLYDIEVNDVTLSDGRQMKGIDFSNGQHFIFADTIPMLTDDVTEIPLYSDEARWYRIGGDVNGASIYAERPEHSAVNVYNKFRELVYSTHVTDAAEEIPLPPDGYIMFHGETGDSIKIFR